MKIIDSLIAYTKLAYGGISAVIASILCGINPKNELKYRKKLSKILISLIAEEIIVEGKLDKDTQILIGNHTHNLDIALIESIINEKIIWIAKKELGEIPIIKYMLTKTDMILVDRKDKKSIIKTLKEVKERVNRGLKVIVFPEGTRNKTNPKKLLPFKKGVKAIPEKLNLKVQPFVIINLPFAFEKNPFRIKKQKIKVVFLESFYPNEENWYEKMRENMQKILDREYNSNKKEKNEV